MKTKITIKKTSLLCFLFWIGIGLGHLLSTTPIAQNWFPFGHAWPINVFWFRLPRAWDFGLVSVSGLVVWHYIYKRKHHSLFDIIIICFVSLLLLNLSQGWFGGMVYPITGPNHFSAAYWNDAFKIRSTEEFLNNFTILQPNLLDHSRVHPPLALLFVYWIQLLLNRPEALTLIWTLITLSSLPTVYSLVRSYTSQTNAMLITFALGLSPAFQIYGLASIDGVIMSLFCLSMLAFVKFLENTSRWTYFWIGLLLTTLSMLFTYAGLLLLGVFLTMCLWQPNRSQLLTISLFYLGFLWWLGNLAGFDYIKSLLIARMFEGPGGVYSFSVTGYFVSRVQDILELVIFGSPIMLIPLLNVDWKALGFRKSMIQWQDLMIKLGQLPKPIQMSHILLSYVGLFFLMGAYYAGETGRAAMFVYPSLFMLWGWQMSKNKTSLNTYKGLLLLLFGHSMVMQLFGWYVW